MKAYGGVKVYEVDTYFLDLGTSWKWVVRFTSQQLYLWGKSPQYPLDRRFSGPQNRSGRFLTVAGLHSDRSVVQASWPVERRDCWVLVWILHLSASHMTTERTNRRRERMYMRPWKGTVLLVYEKYGGNCNGILGREPSCQVSESRVCDGGWE
jgi:hypothetical protein